MINKICPICSSKNTLYKKYYMPEICYYGRKTKGKKIKILECKRCGYTLELYKNSFDKSYKEGFIELRDKVTKEMIYDIIKFYIYEYGSYSESLKELEKILYLKPNYFNDILNDDRKIKSEDAALITIIYNFPFIIKCAARDFDANKSIECIKEFISNLENSIGRVDSLCYFEGDILGVFNIRSRVPNNEILGIKEESSIPISKKDKK